MQMVQTELVQTLTTRLVGVSVEQAADGAGLIFRLLKQKLDDQDFATLDTVIPESDELAAAAPRFEQGNLLPGMLGGINPAVGGSQLAELGNLASLAGCFTKLGLGPEMVQQFVQEILAYVQQQGGDQIKQLVEKALST